MKFFKLIFLFPILLYSFEVKFDKKFEHELPHDTLTSYISIIIEDDSEKLVGQRLDTFNEKIKVFDKVEKNFGTLSIRPKYRHAMNTPKIIGYVGTLKYKINSSKASYMDQLVAELTDSKRNRDTSIQVSDLSWSVREATYNVSLDLLRLEAINWGINYSKNLSNDVNKICMLKDVFINQQNQMMRMSAAKVYTSENLTTKTIPVPQANLEKVIVFANYTMECK